MKTLVLDNKNWQLGASTEDGADFSGVAGLSPDYKGHNYYKSKGDALAGQPSLVAMTGVTLAANIIAGIVDPTTTSRDSILLSADGKIYSTSGLTITNNGDDSAHSTEYTKGKCDLKYFKGSFYATREQGIIKFESNLTNFDYVWWVTTKGKSALSINGPHPMEIVEDTLYIADIEKIHTWDGTTAVEAQAALPVGYTITALRVHTDGRYLKVFATDSFNYFHTDKVVSKMFLFDTTTLEFINEYSLEEQVEGAMNWGGICFCTYGDNFGYFDGSGLKLIRKIVLAGSSDDPIYSPAITIFGNTIIFPSKDYVNAYGDVSGKGNIFFFPFSLVPGNFLHFIIPISNVYCLVQYVDGFGNHKLARLDFSTCGDLTAKTTKIDAGGKLWIRRVDIFLDSLASGGYVQLYNFQSDGSIKEIGSVAYTGDGTAKKKEMFCNILTDFIQPYLIGGSASMVRKIHIQYESAE